MTIEADAALVTAARDVVARARDTLAAARARDELLARLVERRRWLGFERGEAFEEVERVWRLGVLLLGRSGTLYATGQLVRATEPRHPNHQSRLQETRREYRAAALRAGFPEGETVDFDAQPIDFEPDTLRSGAGPLVLLPDGLAVRWDASADDTMLAPFERYLDERVELLVHPPEGA